MIDYSHLQTLLLQLKQRGYRHTTVSPATHHIINARPSNQLAKNIVDVLGWSRPFDEADICPIMFGLMQQTNILQHENNLWRSEIRVSTLDEHYYIHSAYPTKQSDAIFFGPDTYRFIHALNHFFAENKIPPQRAVDICTGCGPAAILLATLFPQSEIYGVDINDTALEFAKFNASVNQVTNTHFVHSNLLNEIVGDFDFITANPPYLVDKSKRAYRHGGGLYGYQLSLDILSCAIHRLKPGGTLLLYTGVAIVDGKDLFLDEVTSLLSATEFSYCYEEIDPDIFAEELLSEPYHVTDRIAAVSLTVRKSALPANILQFEHSHLAEGTAVDEALNQSTLDSKLAQAV